MTIPLAWQNKITAGDCRVLLPQIPNASCRLAFADPPYWVGYDYGANKDTQMDYIEPEWLVSELKRIAEVVLITTGMRHFYDYPKANWIMGWFKPGSTRRSSLGGFNTWEPMLVYGKNSKRFWQDAINLPDGVNHTTDGNFHKCPKPEALLMWLIGGFTELGDWVIDPVAGSGTTCKAAKILSRNFIGFEIDTHVTDKANVRVSNTQVPMFQVESEKIDMFNAAV